MTLLISPGLKLNISSSISVAKVPFFIKPISPPLEALAAVEIS